MKYLFIAVAAVALCWIGLSQWKRTSRPFVATAPNPSPRSNTAVESTPLPPKAPPAHTPVSPSVAASLPPPPAPPQQPAPAPTPAREWSAVPWPTTASPVPEPGKLATPPAPLPQIVLGDVLGPNNLYHDDAFGVSVTYPAGWTATAARRWGTNNNENTVSLLSDTETTARASMYYRKYPNGYPELEGPEAYLRRMAQNKENQRVAEGATDYKNVPDSFEFTRIDGNPALSYFAVSSRGDEVQTEYYVRILGRNGYVMFIAPGRLEDVQKIIPQIKQMAGTVKVQ